MRRSLGDAVKNAFEETIMKNVPIDWFRSLKCKNGAQNHNLREKLSKIGPFGKFDFWSKVNAKSQSQRILVKLIVSAHGSDPGGPGRVGRVNRSTRWHGADEVTLLTWLMTWTRACVASWRGQVTSSGDVRWHHQQLFGACDYSTDTCLELSKARAREIDAWTSVVWQIGELRGRHGGACNHRRIWPCEIRGDAWRSRWKLR